MLVKGTLLICECGDSINNEDDYVKIDGKYYCKICMEQEVRSWQSEHKQNIPPTTNCPMCGHKCIIGGVVNRTRYYIPV